MDRLEAYLDSELADLPPAERDAVRTAGSLIPLLLFADDIVLLARSLQVMQRLLDVLSDFCRANHLEVNLAKSAWVVGGNAPLGAASMGPLWFRTWVG